MRVNQWNPQIIVKAAQSVVEKRMNKAMSLYVGDAKKMINRSQPVKRVGGKLRGLDPSKPGEPPKKVTTRLFQSISKQVTREGRDIVGRYGTNVKYARRLELGFVGTDALGRVYRDHGFGNARPFLRPTFKNGLNRTYRILRSG